MREDPLDNPWVGDAGRFRRASHRGLEVYSELLATCGPKTHRAAASRSDIQTTTIYTRLAPHDLQKVVSLFDENNGGAAQ